MPQGNVDLTFRVKGHKGEKEVDTQLATSLIPYRFWNRLFHQHPTSQGRTLHDPYVSPILFTQHPSLLAFDPIVRFRIIKDDGQIANIPITHPADSLTSSQS